MSLARLFFCILSVQALMALRVGDVRACDSMSGNCSYGGQGAVQNANQDKKVAEDPRKPLSKIARELGWSDATVTRLRRITGFVMCRKEGTMRPFGSGAIVGTDLTLLTAVHLFFDRSGRLRSLDCHFQNQNSPAERVPLRLSRIEDARFGTTNPYEDWSHDWMVIRLTRALPGADPLSVDPDAFLPEGREVIAIRAFQSDVDWVSRKEPIAEICTHWHLDFKVGALPLMELDCQSAPGASGSAVATETGGRFVAVGIHVNADHEVGRRRTRSFEFQRARAVAISSDIIRAIEELSGKTALRASIADAPPFLPRRKNNDRP